MDPTAGFEATRTQEELKPPTSRCSNKQYRRELDERYIHETPALVRGLVWLVGGRRIFVTRKPATSVACTFTGRVDVRYSRVDHAS